MAAARGISCRCAWMPPTASAWRYRLPGHARVAVGVSVAPPSRISSAASVPSARARRAISSCPAGPQLAPTRGALARLTAGHGAPTEPLGGLRARRTRCRREGPRSSGHQIPQKERAGREPDPSWTPDGGRRRRRHELSCSRKGERGEWIRVSSHPNFWLFNLRPNHF